IEKADQLGKMVRHLLREFDQRLSTAMGDLSAELAAMQTALVEVNLLPLVHAVHGAKSTRLTDAEYNGLRLQLATVRQLLGMTQAQISKAADISHVAVQALERGRYRTTRRVLGKYVAALVNEAIAKGIDPNRLPPLPTALEIVAAKRTSLGRRGQSGRRSQKAIDQSLPPSPANSSKQN
ncbi:MAG TPA: helix-turn-helix transcriptional regulator, partial [Pseudomonadota bacterium]|nr:helix-turn-helix transcriptional regulator [Pseudomonadota bacterium]